MNVYKGMWDPGQRIDQKRTSDLSSVKESQVRSTEPAGSSELCESLSVYHNILQRRR